MSYIFKWQSPGPNMVFLPFIIIIFLGMLWILRRQGSLDIVFGGVIVSALIFITYVFVSNKLYPPHITVYENRLTGRENFDFDIPASNISEISSVRMLGTGSRGVSVFLKDKREGKQITVAAGKCELEYKRALQKFCALNGIKFVWVGE